MAERKFTQAQRLAIDTRDKTLLVSAAAGSGKTATLTERIIESLLDAKNPTDISSLLVVTFTNAAAGELRQRISGALSSAIKRGDARLIRQLHLLPAASISTIDSFCVGILRENAERVGISPSFRIADEAEAELLLLSVLEALVNSIYEGNRPDIASAEEFSELTFALTDAKNPSGIYEVFEFVYEKLISTEHGIKTLLPLINVYKEEANLPPEEKKYGKYVMDTVAEYAEHYIHLMGDICAQSPCFCEHPKLLFVKEQDMEFLRSLTCAKTYSQMREKLLSVKFPPKPVIKEDVGADLYFAAREGLKSEAKELAERFFAYDEDMWRRLYRGLYEKLSVFYKFLFAFDEEYAREKKKRGICRYSDIERYAYECLWQNGERTDVAEALRERYSAVYIDEYQDVNNLQDRIFEAISRPDNRFMVGDIKQSIYGFRSAKPEIFAAMRADFAGIEDAREQSAAIFMSENFRSDRGVIDFVNQVFDKAFSAFGKSIGYVAEDRLTYSKKSRDGGHKAELVVFDKHETEGTDTDEESRAEPRYVARKIRELLDGETLADGSPIKPSDIAIVMRSLKGKSDAYKEALDELSIPSMVAESKNFFLNSEVLLALCLLNSIDNPRRDIYLAGLMRSPIFGFSADELVKIKRSTDAHTLYDSLKKYTEQNPGYERGRTFLDTLNRYRDVAEGVNVHSLIAKLYHETSLLSLSGEGRKNLILLYDMARRYEGSEFKGLYSFISYINNLINKKAKFDDIQQKETPDAVKIVTVHGSKGLEYPIVFFVDTGSKISDKDARTRVVYKEDFGIAMYLRSEDGLALVKNPVREAINTEAEKRNFEEELRVLYVALTRARERLYISGERSRSAADFDGEIELLRRSLDEHSAGYIKSHLAVMLVAGAEYTEGKSFAAEESENTVKCEEKVTKIENFEENDAKIREAYDTLVERFSFSYPNKYLTEIPEKLSVSKLYPAVLDGTDGTAAVLFDVAESEDAGYKKSVLPRFIGGRTAAETSALCGIATHLYLQFCDMDRLKEFGTDAELSRLLEKEFLSAEDAKGVRLDEIELFRKSELIDRIRGAKNVWRELRFNIRLPAESFTREPDRAVAVSGEKILVQGVIDCIIENPDGSITLIDYKTDRLTKEELSDRSLAERKLQARYSGQLSYYKQAVLKMFGREPDTVEIYSLPLGDTVEISALAKK